MKSKSSLGSQSVFVLTCLSAVLTVMRVVAPFCCILQGQTQLLHVPVTKIMVGVKIKKMLLVKAGGRDARPTLEGLYLPTRIEVEAATAGAVVVDDDEEDEEEEEDDDWEEVLFVDDAALVVPQLLLVVVLVLLVEFAEDEDEEEEVFELCDWLLVDVVATTGCCQQLGTRLLPVGLAASNIKFLFQAALIFLEMMNRLWLFLSQKLSLKALSLAVAVRLFDFLIRSMQGWSCVPQEGLRERGTAFPVVTVRLVQLIVIGTMMGLQPMKARLDPLMANLLGQVDWLPLTKYSGYQVADINEEEGFTEVQSIEDEDEEEEEDWLFELADDVSEVVVVVVWVVLSLGGYLNVEPPGVSPKGASVVEGPSALFFELFFPDGLSLLQEEFSLVLPLATALFPSESAALREGTTPFQFCNLFSSATCEQLAAQRRITFGFSNLQYSACCRRASRSFPIASWQLPDMVELSVLTESLELPEQPILRELLQMKMAWSVMVSSEPLLEYTPGRLQFRMSGFALVKDSDLLPQMLIRCNCSQKI